MLDHASQGSSPDLPQGSTFLHTASAAGSTAQLLPSIAASAPTQGSAAPDGVGKKGKSILKKYEPVSSDKELYEALDAWRRSKTVDVYGRSALRDIGTCLVLPNPILDQIIDCAHFRKITRPEDLRREADWSQADRYGAEVVKIIEEHPPPPPLDQPSTRSSQQVNRRVPLGQNIRALNGIANVSFRISMPCFYNLPHFYLVYQGVSSSTAQYQDPRGLPSIEASLMARAGGSTPSRPSKENQPMQVPRQRCSGCGTVGHNSKFSMLYFIIIHILTLM